MMVQFFLQFAFLKNAVYFLKRMTWDVVGFIILHSLFLSLSFAFECVFVYVVRLLNMSSVNS